MNPKQLSLPASLETKRLFLRAYRPGDGAWYYQTAQRNKSHLTRFESGNALMIIHNVQDAETIIRGFTESWIQRKAFFLAAFQKDTQEFVAQIYIGVVSWELPEFEIGYFADVDHEGQGYVREAVLAALQFIFNKLGAHRVRLECDDTNSRSSRVAERCGFIQEGHLRENKRNTDGSITGTLQYGMLKREFNLQD